MKTPTDFDLWKQTFTLCRLAEKLVEVIDLMIAIDTLERMKVKQTIWLADVSLN